MRGFADTLAGHGYVVVLLDFAGHGASREPLAGNDDLSDDLAAALSLLRTLSGVDPTRPCSVGRAVASGPGWAGRTRRRGRPW